MPNRTDVQCLHRWQKVLNPELVKGPWSPEEDELVKQLVEKYGPRSWSVIAKHLKGRIGKQCRERWHNHLDPTINREPWTEEEDDLLIEKHEELGNKWAEISKYFNGRTDNMIKNRWNSTIRRRVFGAPTKRRNSKKKQTRSKKQRKAKASNSAPSEEQKILQQEESLETKEESPDTPSDDEKDFFSDFDVSWMDDASILPECLEYIQPNSGNFSGDEISAELSIPEIPGDYGLDNSDLFSSLISSSKMGTITPPFTQTSSSILKKRPFLEFYETSPSPNDNVKRLCNDAARGFSPSTFFGTSAILCSSFLTSSPVEQTESEEMRELFDSVASTEIVQN
mmetsp:Transcript_20894/g.26437  ORF Transcript_20894/g.26437 Transcript_20894/m.26437 type:complete len:339 (+) Transcript_20894:325-1341(+)